MTSSRATSTDSANSTNTQSAITLEIQEQSVSDYLSRTPDFFKRHPQLLSELSLPHHNSGATSLVERQVAVLRERSIKTRHRLSELVDVANDNETLFNKTQEFVIAVLQAPDLRSAFNVTRQQLHHEFDVQISCIGIVSDDSAYWQTRIDNDMLYASSHAQDTIAGVINSKSSFCGALRDSEVDFLFSHNPIFSNADVSACSAAIATRSLAIENRDDSDRLIVGVGHSDPNHYDQQTGTVFLDYIADILQTLSSRTYDR